MEVELEWDSAVDAAGQDAASALSRMPRPPEDGTVPTSLVDMIGEVNKNPRAGMRAAFGLVLRALAEVYPQLASLAPHELVAAMQRLVRQGVMSTEVEWTVSQLYKLFEMAQLNNQVDQAQGYDFLMLAEAAIHVILRSASAATQDQGQEGFGSAPIRPRWRGLYNNDFRIELHILTWGPKEFTGEMVYPDSDTVTRVIGHVDSLGVAGEPISIAWEELEYQQRGSRRIAFNGQYKARISDTTMNGAWYYHDSQRVVAEFEMKAIDA